MCYRHFRVYQNVAFLTQTISRHSLPESPPDSSSEHPYSPQDTCEQQINTSSEAMYTTLGHPALYKPALLNPIITDNLILSSHIVVSEQNGENQMLENNQIIMNEEMRNPMMAPRILQDTFQQSEAGIIQERIILPEGESNRQILIQTQDSNQGYQEGGNLVRLVKNGSDYDKSQLVHLGLGNGVDICEQGGLENVPAVYTNLQNAPKKRKLSLEMPSVKSEPGECF